ncbi:MAG TPA: hypothetical protein VJA82_04005 [Sediminibacterium sp.]|uniref:hypothetical protein n=1 Tax=Sediminibacterium sp. TaxID=1917865 RepID=UPI0008CCDE55|nr:hypothetical protein [Sediminibacterium sp.]OHC85890.1 MAG: hypothetical protein A2472_09185 [Sphingobacteriia bacterium RIFOXYC2_FULL_35_18]OHC87425.1 MAG: hypothetical protein A2546_05340 [Sphingobacteriia bacterium RIFOXYD2_FULL_35_12]HLD52443.1 hypothetical protein [Sediminibacterium sp.]
MIKRYVPFLAFISLLFLTLPLVLDFVTSDVQGWHTTLNAPQFTFRFIILIMLCFLIIGNWLNTNKADKVSWILFSFHVLLTLSTITYLKFPRIFLDVPLKDQKALIISVELRLKFIPVVMTIFFLGQVLLMIGFIRVIKKTKKLEL